MKKMCLKRYVKSQESTPNNEKRLLIQNSYLCVLYIATASFQYPRKALVEEIVLLVYVMIYICQNKVVGTKEYLVNPQLQSIRRRFLLEKFLKENGFTESFIKNGISLGAAIQQFEEYLESTYNSGSSKLSLCFVTNGQVPLRQHMYPEALSKNLQLSKHYTFFYDLQKEFIEYSGLPSMHLSISNMLSYLGMQPYAGSEFCLKEIGDIVNIIRKMLETGYVFANLDTIKHHLVPRVYKKSDTVDDNCIVSVSGLPPYSTEQDVAKFFIGLHIAEGGVALCLNSKSLRNGKAIVRFSNCEHRDFALLRHMHCYKGSYIEVRKASGKDFIDVAGGANDEFNAFLSRGAEVIIKMQNLPYTYTAKQVVGFFQRGENSCNVMHGEEGVLFLKKPKLKTPVVAFVLFEREEDACKALSRHGELIVFKRTGISRITIAEVQQLLNRSVHQMVSAKAAPERLLLPKPVNTSGTRKDFILQHGLPH